MDTENIISGKELEITRATLEFTDGKTDLARA